MSTATPGTVRLCIYDEAGANKLVSGGDILNSPNPEETFQFLESISK